MIPVALAMIRARAVGALTTFLLATFAIAGAVAAPVYLRAAADSVAEADFATAAPGQRRIVANAGVRVRADESDVDGQATVQAHRDRAFDRRVRQAMTADGFTTHLAVFFPLALASRPDAFPAERPEQHLEFREDSCRHVRVVVGRCPAAPGEVMVGEATARRHALRPGATVHVQSMMLVPVPLELPRWDPAGRPAELSVVGEYRTLPDDERYWTGSSSPVGGRSEPVLGDRATLTAVDHERETQIVVAYPTVEAARGLDRAEVVGMLARITATGSSPVTGMPVLLDRIDADRRQAALLPTVAAVPLVLLCCFVLYLAAANTAQVRRLEFGMLKLHGSTRPDRLWLGSAEILLPLLAGAVVGYVVGHVGVWLFGRATLGGPVTLSLTADALPQAAVALAAAVVVCLLGLRRSLAAPVVDLLRRVPSRSARGAGLAARVVAVALAVAAVVQLRTTSELSDVSILAPAAAILAVAVVGAVAFDRVAGRWGRRALRRGRLGLALGLLHLGRRRAGARLLALLAVAIGLVGFAAAAADTATRARGTQVAMRLGAERVVTVQPLPMRTLLSTVRAVDPDGSYAMAVMPLPGLRLPTPLLAVDSPRLARVATPEAGLDAAAAAALRPEVGRTVEIRGDGLVLRAALSGGTDQGATLVTAVLAPMDGSTPVSRSFGRLRAGDRTYRTDVDCSAGCRLENLALSYIPHEAPGLDPAESTVTLTSLTQTGPDAVLADGDDLAAWADHHGAPLRLEPAPSGLAVSLRPTVADGLVGPADTPDTLPGLAAGPGVQVLGIPAPRRPIVIASVVRTVPVLPRLGGVGGLVDMEYLARFDEPGMSAPGEVWLAPDAPADIVERLAAAGLLVDGTRERAAELTAAADRPNAVGVRFFLLVGVLCLLLAAGGLALAGGVEVETRAEELRALRAQGLPRRVVGRAGRLSYLMVVGAGVVLGGLAGAVAWVATSDRLPLVDQLVTGLTTPRWPGPAAGWALAGSTVALGAVAVLVAAVLSYRSQRAVATRGTGREGSTSS